MSEGSSQKENHKRERWEELLTKFSSTGDRLGKEIDSKILETVVVLNALGINTISSCEGHLNWGIRAPWVDIEATEIESLEKDAHEALERVDEAENQSSPKDQVDELYRIYHEKRNALKKRNVEVISKLLPFLDEFYQNRSVSARNRLVLSISGNGNARLESQGAELQETLPTTEREQWLREYQLEMKDFTEFLKAKYYQD